jgi:glycosyl-4,4'-diaponeurosporenoate acyltransferase
MSELPQLPPLVLVALYAAIWLAFHFGVGFLMHRLPSRAFVARGGLSRSICRLRRFERGGVVYERVLGIRRWKHWLPEAGDFYRGGVSKATLQSRSKEHLGLHLRENRRAELSHWLTAALSLTFFLWNPWYVGLIMIGYAAVTNLPCILVQRFNRARMLTVYRKAGGEE